MLGRKNLRGELPDTGEFGQGWARLESKPSRLAPIVFAVDNVISLLKQSL